jgi:hypothetical protein
MSQPEQETSQTEVSALEEAVEAEDNAVQVNTLETADNLNLDREDKSS